MERVQCEVRKRIGFPALLALVLATPLVVPGPARAVCGSDPCATGGSLPANQRDCDQDGFTDQEECSGISTATGAGLNVVSCRATGAVRPNCLDPKLADVFVIFQKDTSHPSGSAFNQLGIGAGTEFRYITQTLAAGGLPLQLHQLAPGALVATNPNNQPNGVTPTQGAILVQEKRETLTFPCPVVDALGSVSAVTSANEGNNLVVANVFSARILRHVDCVYASVNDTTTDRNPAKTSQLLHTTAHEATHLMELAPESDARLGGQHYRSGSGCVLDQSSQASTKGGKVTFTIPTRYCGPDVNEVQLGSGPSGPPFCSDASATLDGDVFTQGCKPLGP